MISRTPVRSAALREAVLSPGACGPVSTGDTHPLRKQAGAGRELAREIAAGPAGYFGPFDSLTAEARKAIVEAIAREDRWRMRGHEIGDWHIKLAQFFTGVRRPLSQRGLTGLSRLAEALALAFRSGPAFLLHMLYRGLLSCHGRAPLPQTLPSLLSRIGLDPRNLAVCYARNMLQPESYRGFHHDAGRHNTYGVLLGIDLLPADGGFWYIESNLDFGMSRTRAALYDHDPFVTNLVDFAGEQGYRNLMVVHKSASHLNECMARQYAEEARARGIRLTLVEDAYLPPQPGCIQSYGVPACVGNDTLVVRSKYYPTSLDYLFQHKNASIRALTAYKQHVDDPALQVPMTGNESVLEDVRPGDPFPNLVYKLPERDEGKGVIFIKAESREHATLLLEEALRRDRPRGILGRLYAMLEDGNGLFQPYIRSSMLPGRRLYKVRAHVLISPAGARFLSAHRVVSQHEVPHQLPLGLVEDRRPYLVNLSTSSNYELVPPDEEQAVIEAALAIGRGLSWAASYGFRTTAGEGPDASWCPPATASGGAILK